MEESSSYKNIFKTTFLFSFVKVFNILTRVAVNKAVAILLGAEGLGIISLYNNAINVLKSGCGLGIKQSAVRDISEANKEGKIEKISEIITVTDRVILFTGLLGLIITLLGAPFLSKYSFGNNDYIIPFVVLSAAVAFDIYAEGQMAILTGMRRLKDLAKVNVIGSIIGMVASIPLYYFFGKDGIVPSLIISALCLFITTKFYVYKIETKKVNQGLRFVFLKAMPMVKMGGVLMIAGFAGLAFDLFVSVFIRYEGGLENVGYFQAGATIITSYFGIVLTAMTTDYYPRICGVNKDNKVLKDELNKQVAAGVILLFPLAVCFVYLAPFFITFLYSNEFAVSTQYTDFAILGTIIIVASNCMGMIFMAKMASKLYLVLVFVVYLCLLCVYVPLYHFCGLRGLGISYIMNGVTSLVLFGVVLYKKYNIYINRGNIVLILTVMMTIILTLFARNIPNLLISIMIGSVIFVISTVYSFSYLKKNMSIDISAYVKNRIKQKNENSRNNHHL